MTKEICFVCTGNVCRSPVGEGLARLEIDRRGLDYVTSSAGTDAVVGESASENSVTVCQLMGVDLSAHKARQLDSSFVREDLVFAVMTDNHRAWLKRFLGVPEDMIYLIGAGIPDPYLQPLSVYKKCADAVSDAIPELLDRIVEDDKNRISVRPAATEDIEFIRDLEETCLGHERSYRSVEEELQFEHSRILVAEREGARLGFISSQITADCVYISNLCTAPEHRRTGVGSHLLYSLRALAVSEGCSEVTLEVRESNLAAISLYSACGFRYLGKRPGFYTNPEEAAEIMTALLI